MHSLPFPKLFFFPGLAYTLVQGISFMIHLAQISNPRDTNLKLPA